MQVGAGLRMKDVGNCGHEGSIEGSVDLELVEGLQLEPGLLQQVAGVRQLFDQPGGSALVGGEG